MKFETLAKRCEKKDRIVEATFKLVGAFGESPTKYSLALDNYYLVLNKELGIK